MEGNMTAVENPYEKVRPKMVAARIEFLGQLAKFSPDELQKRPGPGGWSPLQLAYHLYIADGLALEELNRGRALLGQRAARLCMHPGADSNCTASMLEYILS
jgi:hypothetical protein